MLDVKEGCVDAYKYSAVVVVGLLWDLGVGWGSRMKGPFVRVELLEIKGQGSPLVNGPN